MVVFILLFALLFPFALVLVYLYSRHRKSKELWKNKKIPYKEPQFLAGNFAKAGTTNLGLLFRELYEEAKNEKVFGIWQFTVPVLLILDLELIKKVLIVDFDHFDDHGVYFDAKTDPLAANLLTLGGSAWRNLRTKLNPAFTSGKLRAMFPLIVARGEELARALEPSAKERAVVEFKDLFARYTTDVISTCAFGIETDSLSNENAIFRTMGKKVFQPSWEVLWRNFVGFLFPDFAKFFKIRIYPKRLTEFFVNVVRETMNYRELNKVNRNDILQLLTQLKSDGLNVEPEDKQNSDSDFRGKLTCEQAAAQAFIFFTAGFETSSTTMQYALYELSMNEEIQDRARDEIQRVLSESDGRLTYDSMQAMTYLSRIVDETLRKYPPATNLNRVCTKEWKLPGTETVLEKGTQVSVSVLGLHWDDRYYPEPHKFDPERFSDEEKSKRPPCTYMPFGEGPRICIGQRFGLTQVKIGLIFILSRYRISIAKEKTQIPPIYDPKSFFSAPQGGMHLRISLLSQ